MIAIITITVKLDDDVWGDSDEGIDWLKEDVLSLNGELILHSNMIGDEVGEVTDVKVLEIIKTTTNEQ